MWRLTNGFLCGELLLLDIVLLITLLGFTFIMFLWPCTFCIEFAPVLYFHSYDSSFSASRVFHLDLQWSVCSSASVDEFVQQLYRWLIAIVIEFGMQC